MKRNRGTRGAISVFLALILVPCIVVSSLFVDVSRVNMAKAMSESSADLALNSLLTNYDADLSDWYGMVASCQTIEQFYTVSAEYFLRTISSQELSKDEIDLLVDYYAAATSDDTIYDLLQVECAPDTSVSVGEVKDANLSNAALLKDQVVEFMKYRGPIEIVSNIVTRFKNDPTTEEAQEADANEELVQAKQDFYESEGALVEAAFESYKAIKKYYDQANEDGLSNESLAGMYTMMDGYKSVYKEILRYVISNLSNTNGLQRYARTTITKTYYNDLYSNPERNFSEVYSEKKKENGAYVYYIDLDDVKDLVDDLLSKRDAFNTARANFEGAAQPVLNDLPYGTDENNTNAIQWWRKMNNAVNSSSDTNHTTKVKEAAQSMMRAYSRVLAIEGCVLKGTIPVGWTALSDWKTQYGADTLITDVEALQARYLTAGVKDDSDTYLKAVSQLESVSNANYGNINPANLYVTVDEQRKKLGDALAYISIQLNAARTELQNYVDLLEVAINGDGKDVPSLDELLTYVTDYESKLKDWSDKANNTYFEGEQTKLSESDQSEISTLKTSVEIKKEDVDELKTRLKNIQSQIKAVISAIDSLKWCGTAIKDITTVDTFKSKAAVDTSKIGLKNSAINSYTDTLFGEKFAPQTIPSFEHGNDSAYNPLIDPRTEEVDTPALWLYLYKKYSSSEDKVEEAKKESDAAKDTGTKKADAAKKADRYKYKGENVPYAFSSAEKFSLGDSLNSVMNFITALVGEENALTALRDDLYVTSYIMEMFSHATYEYEGQYSLVDDEKKTELRLSNYPDYYGAVLGAEDGSEKKTWLSTAKVDYYNKTLTNKQITPTNNAAYCAEIEYILCGSNGSTNDQNVKDVFEKIYGIRYGLNLVSGFENFWSASGTKDPTAVAIGAAANAVYGMSMGVIPQAVTKAVLIPILAIFETANDLDRLGAGFPVELYKSEPGMWWISLSPQSDEDEAGEQVVVNGIGDFMSKIQQIKPFSKHNTGEGIFYSDYLTLFVYLGLSGGAENGMLQRMAEVMQFNLGKLTGKGTEYSLQKSRMYFTLDATIRVKPLMINLPIFNDEDYQNNLLTELDWCTYEVSTVRGYS